MMSSVEAYERLRQILDAAQRDENHTLALKAIKLLCQISGVFEKKRNRITVAHLTDQQIQELIDQLGKG
jgi:oligoendopeptidase F